MGPSSYYKCAWDRFVNIGVPNTTTIAKANNFRTHRHQGHLLVGSTRIDSFRTDGNAAFSRTTSSTRYRPEQWVVGPAELLFALSWPKRSPFAIPSHIKILKLMLVTQELHR